MINIKELLICVSIFEEQIYHALILREGRSLTLLRLLEDFESGFLDEPDVILYFSERLNIPMRYIDGAEGAEITEMLLDEKLKGNKVLEV